MIKNIIGDAINIIVKITLKRLILIIVILMAMKALTAALVMILVIVKMMNKGRIMIVGFLIMINYSW